MTVFQTLCYIQVLGAGGVVRETRRIRPSQPGELFLNRCKARFSFKRSVVLCYYSVRGFNKTRTFERTTKRPAPAACNRLYNCTGSATGNQRLINLFLANTMRSRWRGRERKGTRSPPLKKKTMMVSSCCSLFVRENSFIFSSCLWWGSNSPLTSITANYQTTNIKKIKTKLIVLTVRNST